MTTLLHRVSFLLVVAVAVSACSSNSKSPGPGGLTAESHKAFPIGAGTAHAMGRNLGDSVIACESCHDASGGSFSQFSCVGCHDHSESVTTALHLGQPTYTFTSAACLSCHPTGAKVPVTHAGITQDCAACHDTGKTFAALPVAGLVHPAINGADCATCHAVASWAPAFGAPTDSRDPARSVSVMAQIPTFVDVKITALAPRTQALPMTMNHQSTEAPSAAFTACKNCHANAAAAIYTAATFHDSLTKLNLPKPHACASCHADAVPVGFVGPTSNQPARTPASGAMRHDAIAWTNNAPTATRLVSQNCGICHASPTALGGATPWAVGLAGASPALYHAALTSAGESQPTSCLDCHASTRPQVLLTSSTAAIPAGATFDHGWAMGDCLPCHQASARTGWTSWTGAEFHIAGSSNPPTCLPCHASSAPTNTSGWLSATYSAKPFDYGTNGDGIAHGGAQDCVLCHKGPGTGAWGAQSNWSSGHYEHEAFTLVDSTCSACHSSQRPDLLPNTTPAQVAALIGFDHAPYAKVDCVGCHYPTVIAGNFVNYFNPATGALPGGDWKGGHAYPGSKLVGFPYERIQLTTTTLTYATPGGPVTGTNETTSLYYDMMLHTSSAIPAQLTPGPDGAPNLDKCWHCHPSVNGVVTNFGLGKFHDSLARYTATVGADETPLPQPVSNCRSCHAPTQPIGIVKGGPSGLAPMNHAAEFVAGASIGSVPVAKVSDLDCSLCHHDPLGLFSDGVFHASIGQAAPKDCVTCHYLTLPGMSNNLPNTVINSTTLTRAGVASGVAATTLAQIRHTDINVATRDCGFCHTQSGPSTAPAITGKEWAQARLHTTGAGTAYSLVINGTTGRCSNCHINERPGAAYATLDHRGFANASGSTDCGGCHKFPGTGTLAAPNWLGASTTVN